MLPHKALISFRTELGNLVCEFLNPFTQKVTTKSFSNITEKDVQNWINGGYIQQSLKNLTAEDRELFLSGLTPEEWDEIFGKVL